MSADFTISKGLNLPMLGAPGTEIRKVSSKGTISVFPSEFQKVKFKSLVEEGAKVARGTKLARRKDLEGFFVCSPVSGTVKAVNLGERRSLKEIVIESDGSDAAENFHSFTVDGILRAKAENVMSVLLESGLLGLIRQRPFNRIANPADKPKSIFVNGMATAPFRPDAHILAQGKADAVQIALNALTLFTDGPVHLNLDAAAKDSKDCLTEAAHVQVNYFNGPHPSGNTSTHIHNLDPILPGDTVWTLRVSDLVRIGELLLTGLIPNEQRIVLSGEGFKESHRGYVDVPTGIALADVLEGALAEGESRIIRGDTLAGEAVNVADTGIFYYDQGFVALPEDRERYLMGWYAPALDQYSAHKVAPSHWLKNKLFHFGTNLRGGHRAMVMTGIYDAYVTLDIMVDPLIRACIANETEDAIAMGILESDPEDFALCTFVCPSKTDFGKIISETLDLIEQEGF
ncbi:NADH:ubiquinone reductase (Na(+)-transporting) subunit A [Kiritimatiellota bacterium B12222]|nr:NADH:ubiquinone reductase (Na(+)-transporting) subunit A [Kiritimatiellota bacterium B12222]